MFGTLMDCFPIIHKQADIMKFSLIGVIGWVKLEITTLNLCIEFLMLKRELCK